MTRTDTTPADAGSWAGRRVVVMGLGRFGGGAGAARWLAEQGADVLVTDLADADTLAEPVRSIRDLVDAGRIAVRLGGHDEADFRRADAVVVSPAVHRPWENRFVLAAVERGTRLTTEIRLLVERLPNRERVVGVTGTAGKSTTAAMIAHILRSVGVDQSPDGEQEVADGPDDGRDARPTGCCDDGRDARPSGSSLRSRVWLGGNIGGSLLPRVHEIAADDWVVLELSSAMLYWLGDWFVGRRDEPGWSPHIVVVTNVSPNHLDWHGEFAHYARCKRGIVAHQRAGDRALRADDAEPAAGFGLVGAHNALNAGLAIAGARAALGGRTGDVRVAGALASFMGLPHRLQLVAEAERGGGVIRAYNDSKCTTPEAAALAVAAFATDATTDGGTGVSPVVGAVPVHLIVGGSDKGVDLSPMVEAAAHCRGVYTIGATGPMLARLIRDAGGGVEEAGDLAAATARAIRMAEPGEAVVLSPGCASLDQFENYERRGARFTALVRASLGLPPAAEGLFKMPPAVGP